MHRGWESCSARKSCSSEWPSRIVDGVMSVRRCACTSASDVVIDSRVLAVIPEKLESGVMAQKELSVVKRT
jgi:hypothetical protein